MDTANAELTGMEPESPSTHEGTDDTALGSAVSPALIVLTNPSCIEAEAIRGLRTRIMAQHVREGRRALAICAPSAEADTPFVTANLGAAVAQIGVKTAIIDANLRAPSLGSFFGLDPDLPGLADYLGASAPQIDYVIRTEVIPNLAIIPAGSMVANPQELLGSTRFPMLVNQLLREFDLTIFDTAPAHNCTDAQRVATVAGYSLIVARKHDSFMNDISTLSRMLRADRSVIIGSVLNDY